MSQKQHYIKDLNTKSVCKNLKEQEFVWLCKESIFKWKDETILQKFTRKKCKLIFYDTKSFKKFKTLPRFIKNLKISHVYFFYHITV